MEIKEGFVLRTICGQHVLSGEGAAHVNFSKLVCLNDTATFLYEHLVGKPFTVDTIVSLLTDNYEVDEAQARRDAIALCEKWKETGILA